MRAAPHEQLAGLLRRQGDGCLDSKLDEGGGTFASIYWQEWLQAVSICFQADFVRVAGVAQRVGFAISAIKKRATIYGDIERAVHRYITTGKGPWEQGSLQIVRCSAEELSENNQDREGICDDLVGSFTIRYLTALPDPIVKALRVLDTSRWPVYEQQDTAELDAHGNDDVSLLVENYRVFFEDATGAKVLAQWEQIKQTIASDPQPSRKEFNVLWPRMLSQSGFVKQARRAISNDSS